MALKRTIVGSLMKAKPPEKATDARKPNYFKVEKDIPKGTIIRLESKQFQQESLERAIRDGKIGADTAKKVQDRLDKMPDFVMAEGVVLSEAN